MGTVTHEHRGIFTLSEPLLFLSREPELRVESLGRDLWTVTDGVYRTLFSVGKEGVLAFDTLGTPGAARAYRRKIAEVAPSRAIRTVIYSHDHLDHAGYAADLAPDAEIIADEATARVIALRNADGQLKPTRTVRGERNAMSIDGLDFELLNPGPTHGTGNIAAYFPDRRLLFMSDTVLPNACYGLLPDYHIANFVRLMRELSRLDFTTFVPGRYPVMTRDQFLEGCDYFEALQDVTQQAFAEGVPVWILEAVTGYAKQHLRPRFGRLDGFDTHVGLSAFRIIHHYLMGGYGLEDTPGVGLPGSSV